MFYLKTCKIVYDTCICSKSIANRGYLYQLQDNHSSGEEKCQMGGLNFIYDISLNDKSPKEITKCCPLNLHGDTCTFEIFMFLKCPEVQFGGIF